MKIYTIGFTKKSAERFFGLLSNASTKRLIDIRLNNVSQLAGFTRRDDLAYFTRTILGIEYLPLLELAPTKELLDGYRQGGERWDDYEIRFRELITSRRIEERFERELFDEACLLCSEEMPLHCHRRLVAEYLREKWGGLEIVHLT